MVYGALGSLTADTRPGLDRPGRADLAGRPARGAGRLPRRQRPRAGRRCAAAPPTRNSSASFWNSSLGADAMRARLRRRRRPRPGRPRPGPRRPARRRRAQLDVTASSAPPESPPFTIGAGRPHEGRDGQRGDAEVQQRSAASSSTRTARSSTSTPPGRSGATGSSATSAAPTRRRSSASPAALDFDLDARRFAKTSPMIAGTMEVIVDAVRDGAARARGARAPPHDPHHLRRHAADRGRAARPAPRPADRRRHDARPRHQRQRGPGAGAPRARRHPRPLRLRRRLRQRPRRQARAGQARRLLRRSPASRPRPAP